MSVPRLTAPRARVVVGAALLTAAALWRFAGPRSAVVLNPDPLPAVTEADIVTIPLAATGLALLASAPRIPTWRRAAGVLCLLVAILLPTASKPRSGPVILTISRFHGVHVSDLLAILPALAGATLLAFFRPLQRRMR